MGVKYSCYNKCHIICIFNPIDSLWPKSVVRRIDTLWSRPRNIRGYRILGLKIDCQCKY
jgi:hypothetical protein